MPEANVANTVTILGRTNVLPVFTHWKTVVSNDPENRAAIKVNSLFITNRSINSLDVDLRIARDPDFAPGAVYFGHNHYSYIMNKWVLPQNTTIVAISRDNPIWLQPGDFLQVLSSLNYCAEAVCSYEFISDQSPAPTTTVTTPGPVLNLNAAPVFKSGTGNNGGTSNGGVDITWTPPFSTGGVDITNYLVQWRAKIAYATSPTTFAEGYTNWLLLERPVSSVPNLTISPAALLAWPRDLGEIQNSYAPIRINLTTYSANPDIWSANDIATSDITGFQFRVAAYNPVGLGTWSDPSDFIRMDTIGTIGDDATIGGTRVGVVDAITVEAVPHGAVLNWLGHEARLNPKTSIDEVLTIKDYRLRWSDDNGVTWYPSAAGIRLDSDASSAEVRGLKNDVGYVFSVQTICQRVAGSTVDEEIIGPWSLPTRSVTPPGYTTDAQRLGALKVMFVRWV